MTMLRHALAAVTANPSAASRTRAASSSVGDIAPARARATPLSRAASFLQGGRVKVRTNALPAPAPRGRSAAPVTRALFGKKPAS